ncbi:peptide chain release factor 2 [Candidatus Comchoanobacter bicostacola]|uniref:peptide chain release factor 2 n=1 Tax=Candidatus Comchoanobacter bicostacola TaxID=2919598 RepID=UPI002867EAE5|nr:peptide chain release factor 2 [Candidatus Comchoanobacter bicostacola]
MLSVRCSRSGGIFDLPQIESKIAACKRIIEDPEGWKDPDKIKKATAEHKQLSHFLSNLQELEERIALAYEFLELLSFEEDDETKSQLTDEVKSMAKDVHDMEMQRFFSGDQDMRYAYMDIQSGSGGTEAQDWAQMLMRMYMRWAETHGFSVSVTQIMKGDVAGIRSATLLFEGPYAFGWLKTESGVHRLVRKSPFDSGNRRHTSFASIFIYPEIDDTVAVDINPSELRIDTYRSSGAGGQHVNTTDSAVRITHLPSGVVVQCQAERSQHKNKANAMKQLQAKLHSLALDEQNQEKQALEDKKDEITWGQQIRSYVLDQSRIKDLRTGVEVSHTQSVLDGGIDPFIRASLQQAANQQSKNEE